MKSVWISQNLIFLLIRVELLCINLIIKVLIKMANETIPTSIQWAGQLPVWSANPLDLVDGKTAQSNATWTIKHENFLDKIIRLIAKITWNPDPFTWKASSVVAPKTENTNTTQNISSGLKPENQTSAVSTQTEEWWLFGKFTSTLTDIWNVVENLWNDTLWKATTVVNKWLEKAGQAWEKVVSKATNVVNEWLVKAEQAWEKVVNKAKVATKQATDTVTDFVSLEEPKKEWSVTTQQ